MNMKEKISVIRQAFSEKKEKASDLDIIVAQIMSLPYGQLKKVCWLASANDPQYTHHNRLHQWER